MSNSEQWFVKRYYMVFSLSKKSWSAFLVNKVVVFSFSQQYLPCLLIYKRKTRDALFKAFICSFNHLFVEQLFTGHIL